MATIPRVDSTASELNDFQETKEGKKIYNVSMSMIGLFWLCNSQESDCEICLEFSFISLLTCHLVSVREETEGSLVNPKMLQLS